MFTRQKMLSFALILALTAGLLFPLSGGVHAGQASAQTDRVLLDGVTYTLQYADGSADAELLCPEQTDGLPAEITVRSQITYNGVTFAVNSFRAGISDEYGGTIGELVKRGAYEPDYYQNHLRKIHIEEGVRNISVSLAHYASLEEIHIANPADCHSITMNLWDCPKMKDIYVPASADLIPQLRECPDTTVTYAPDHPKYTAEDGAIYSKDGRILYDVSSDAKKYTVKKGVKTIATLAFSGNDAIRKVILPASVRKLEGTPFFNMKNLRSVKLSQNIRRIDGSCFRRCGKLTSLKLPKNVRSIVGFFGNKKNCKLKSLYIHAPSLKKAIFRGLPKPCTIYVKNETVKKQIQKQSNFKGQIIVQQ